MKRKSLMKCCCCSKYTSILSPPAKNVVKSSLAKRTRGPQSFKLQMARKRVVTHYRQTLLPQHI